MLGRRVVVPASCRKRVLESRHSAHQGSAKMLERAKHSVYWPGIVDDLEQTRKSCSICDRNPPKPVIDASIVKRAKVFLTNLLNRNIDARIAI